MLRTRDQDPHRGEPAGEHLPDTARHGRAGEPHTLVERPLARRTVLRAGAFAAAFSRNRRTTVDAIGHAVAVAVRLLGETD